MPCGRSIHGNARYFPHGSYHGRRVFFCTEYCRSAFEAEPERFLKVHRRMPAEKREKQSI